MRDTITFTVPIGKAPKPEEQRWLDADGGLAEEGDAVAFTLYKLPSEGEKIGITMRCHELTGGLRGWVDLLQGSEAAYEVITARYEATIWPGEEGRPTPENDEEEKAHQKLIDAKWNADTSADKAGYLEMRELRERVEFMAMWPALFQRATEGGKEVADWDDLSEKPLGTLILRMVMAAYHEAVGDFTAGKTQPSGS